MRKNLARLAAAALLATGIFAGGSGPAMAAPAKNSHSHVGSPITAQDTGWG